ncbi:peptidylprolyl isomerase [Pseudobdellovibrio exovorus]|uniref:Periplasmic chaperone PpiD n=1 Tax=Pseudobdellovibrio exovorus JSS TaxID=1184267 RepID=M4VPY0_9BACT|nr:SurA N-terminal domain-containing protein [Pseudobdellovibrio exovorus]AGH95199.1 hypothetical protein A11Q_983 [Pseudobdellovibrio exovorus JSS]
MKNSHQMSVSAKIKKGLSDKGVTVRSVVAVLIFGMIVLVFILSGRHQGGSMSMGAAAEVNGELISIKEFQEEEERLAQYYSQLFGGQLDSDMQRTMLRGEVMNTLVSKSLAAQAAEKSGIYATDAEVRYMIVEELPYFKTDGVFQADTYRAVLQSNRLTTSEFEGRIRQDIKNQRSRQLFESSLTVSELQKEIEKELRSSKINLEYAQLSSVEYAKAHPVTDAELQKALATEDFLKKVEENYKVNESSYETPAQVRASHILIAMAGNEAAALEKAKQALKRLEKESFEKVAAQVSEDPGSKVKNGDLGYFSKGQMVKEFEDAAFSLPVGKLSDIVKTQFGFHIIKVTDKKEARKDSFESVKNALARKLLADERYLTFVKGVEAELAAGRPEVAVAQLSQAKVAWKETGLFDIGAEVAPGMNSAQAIKLGLELSSQQPVAKRLIREGDVQFLVKLKGNKFVNTELKPEEESVLERQKAMEAYAGWVDAFRKTAKVETNSFLINPPQ